MTAEKMSPDHVAAQITHYERKLAFEIDSWDLKVALDSGANVTVIDARSADAFAHSHIPDAQNIPHREMDESSTRHLDRSSLMVTYCDGIGCNASTKGALNMAKLGFNVRELIGGLDWWIRDGHPTETAGPPDESDLRSKPRNNSPNAGSCGCG